MSRVHAHEGRAGATPDCRLSRAEDVVSLQTPIPRQCDLSTDLSSSWLGRSVAHAHDVAGSEHSPSPNSDKCDDSRLPPVHTQPPDPTLRPGHCSRWSCFATSPTLRSKTVVWVRKGVSEKHARHEKSVSLCCSRTRRESI